MDPAVAEAGGETPDQALAAFLEHANFVIPRVGYEPIGRTGDRFAFAYRSGGRVKVVIVISPRYAEMVRAQYAPDELRACPLAEFGADADLGGGFRVWAHDQSGLIITDIAGLQHCGWESARLMHIEEPRGVLIKQYVRDPLGVLPPRPLLDSYAAGGEVPADATFSGYRSGEDELWFTPGDSAAYVVTPAGVERWPRAEPPIGCM